MLLSLTEDYVASKFYQYCGKPSFNKAQKVYQGSCPICREGKSWLKKRRCYYLVEQNSVCCHNCGWFSKPYNWVVRVTGLNFHDIKKEIESDSYNRVKDSWLINNIKAKPVEVPELPKDSINLFDEEQVQYYKNNPVVCKCVEVISKRKLNKAINRPISLFTSLNDPVHQNRLIIPFYSTNKKIDFYQSREVMGQTDTPRYLSKVNSEKSLFGYNTVGSDLEYIFITEGPIDAMFIKNGVAVAGINESRNKSFSPLQDSQLRSLPFHKRVWVLDNQENDSASKKKSKMLLEANELVFLWPKSLSDYKDLNEYCVDKNCNAFDTDMIIENTYQGLKGLLLLANYSPAIK